jgi:hypothetical protein
VAARTWHASTGNVVIQRRSSRLCAIYVKTWVAMMAALVCSAA